MVEHDLREPFDLLSEAYKLYQDHQAGNASYYRRTSLQTADSAAHNEMSGAADEREDLITCLAAVLAGQVSSKDVMVRSSRLGLTWANGVWLDYCSQVKRALPTLCGG